MLNTSPRTAELLEISKGMYLSLVGLTNAPAEAMSIICMMHLHLFLNHGDPDTSVDDMLKDYTKNFKKNWDANKGAAQ